MLSAMITISRSIVPSITDVFSLLQTVTFWPRRNSSTAPDFVLMPYVSMVAERPGDFATRRSVIITPRSPFSAACTSGSSFAMGWLAWTWSPDSLRPCHTMLEVVEFLLGKCMLAVSNMIESGPVGIFQSGTAAEGSAGGVCCRSAGSCPESP